MKVLLDNCVAKGAIAPLILAGHDVEWVGYLEVDPGDEAILRRAVSEQRILITLDKDFGELVFRDLLEHSGIIRLAEIRASEQADVLIRLLTHYERELIDGAIITADRTRVRLNRPRDKEDD